MAQVQSVIYFLKELIFNNICRSMGSPKFQVFRRSVCRIISNMTWNVRGDSKMKNSSKIQIQNFHVDCQLRLGHSLGRVNTKWKKEKYCGFGNFCLITLLKSLHMYLLLGRKLFSYTLALKWKDHGCLCSVRLQTFPRWGKIIIIIFWKL